MLLLRSALLEACSNDTPMCVVHAAHAGEVLLKARIAQEHFLLIFDKLPETSQKQELLTLPILLEKGQTVKYSELPSRLWATTGIRMDGSEKFLNFGKLRNQIIHCGIGTKNDLDIETIRYCLEVIDPLVESFWRRSVIDFIKNDPFLSEQIYLGFLEGSLLEKGFSMDRRLRDLIGPESKESLQRQKEISECWARGEEHPSMATLQKPPVPSPKSSSKSVSLEEDLDLRMEAWYSFIESF